jgi:hypothetical protein
MNPSGDIYYFKMFYGLIMTFLFIILTTPPSVIYFYLDGVKKVVTPATGPFPPLLFYWLDDLSFLCCICFVEPAKELLLSSLSMLVFIMKLLSLFFPLIFNPEVDLAWF